MKKSKPTRKPASSTKKESFVRRDGESKKKNYGPKRDDGAPKRDRESPKREGPVSAPKKDLPYVKKTPELFIWGKRTVETYFSRLHASENIQVAKYKLHIIVDKTNKAPAQLKPLVESAKALGISISAHQSAEEGWPLADSTDLNHQRVCLKIPEYPVSTLNDVTKYLNDESEDDQNQCVGLILDQIQDPRNFGAILRSAAFFGAKFVVYATDRQSDISGLVLKTSAGGAFSLMLVPVVNLNRAMAQLKESGVWIVGTSLQEKSVNLKELPKDRKWIVVLGNEEKGLRNEVAKNCDYLVTIPGLEGGVESLNVSVAAGICLHELKS